MAKTKGTAALKQEAITVGDWVQCKKTLAFGQVEADTGKLVTVQWGSGETTRENKESLSPSAPNMYFQAIREFAEKELGNVQLVFEQHGAIANGRDKMSLAVLSELEGKLLSMSTVEVDKNYEDVAEALFEQTAQPTAQVFDIFAAFGIGDPENPKQETAPLSASGAVNSTESSEAAKSGNTATSVVAATTGGDSPKSVAPSAEASQQQRSAESAESESVELLVSEPGFFCADCGKSSLLREVKEIGSCPHCLYAKNDAKNGPAFPITRAHIEKFFADDTKENSELKAILLQRLDERQDLLVAGLGLRPQPAWVSGWLDIVNNVYIRERNGECTREEIELAYPKSDGVIAANLSGSSALSVAAATTDAIRTDAGLVDPETGELIEESFILRKLGWTEFPKLSANPTKQELDEFEEKLDQVVDRMLSHTDKTDRWRAATEKKCEPFDKAAAFWNEQFVQPLAKQLGAFRLPKNKKGEFSKKTLNLSSGAVKFTQTGGAFVHDADQLKAHIKEVGVKTYSGINAREVIQYDHQKLISLLNKGTLVELPGTGIKPKDPFGKITVLSPHSKPVDEDPEGGGG